MQLRITHADIDNAGQGLYDTTPVENALLRDRDVWACLSGEESMTVYHDPDGAALTYDYPDALVDWFEAWLRGDAVAPGTFTVGPARLPVVGSDVDR